MLDTVILRLLVSHLILNVGPSTAQPEQKTGQQFYASREEWELGKVGPHRQAMAAMREESRPPESSMARGASDISRFTTEATSVSCPHHKPFS